MKRGTMTYTPSHFSDLPDEAFDNPARFYRYQIGQVDLLTTEETIQLAQVIERGKEERIRARQFKTPLNRQVIRDAEQAKQRMIEANLRLVVHFARRYRAVGIDILDLIQEGNLGLIHAVDKYDWRMGRKFSTYASYWIRQYLSRAVTEQAHTIRVPLYKVDEIKRLNRIRRQLQQSQEEDLTLEELARQMEMGIPEVVDLMATTHAHETVSLDQNRAIGKNGDDSSLYEAIEDDSIPSPEREIVLQTLRMNIQELLQGLTSKERRVIELRYGLEVEREATLLDLLQAHSSQINVQDRQIKEQGRPLSLTETGKVLGMSHEAVRQIEFRALRNLYDPSRARRLQEYLS